MTALVAALNRIADELHAVHLLLIRVAWNQVAQSERRDSEAAEAVPGPSAKPARRTTERPAEADRPPAWLPAGVSLNFSAERDALLMRQYKHVPAAEWLAALNALPGPRLSPRQCYDRMKYLRRTQGEALPASVLQAAPADFMPPVQAAPAGESQATDVPLPETPRPADLMPPAAPFAEGPSARLPAPDHWSDARLNLAKDMVARRAPWREVWEAVNALPGTRFPDAAGLQAMLGQRGIKRPPAPPDGGEASVLRSTARPAELLTGTTAKAPVTQPSAPFRAVPPALAERDGMLSGAKLQLLADDAQPPAPIALGDALNWGAHNGCQALRGESWRQHFQRVNVKRAELGLPRFTLITARGPLATLPDPAVGGGRPNDLPIAHRAAR